MSSVITRQKFKNTWRKKFSRDFKPIKESNFPSSLSPISTIGDGIGFSHSLSISSDLSMCSTTSSSSSMTSGDGDLMGSLSKSKGPKVKPYFYSHMQKMQNSEYRKNLQKESCFICEEAISTKLAEESIIELVCGDYIHEQCLKISIDVTLKRMLESFCFTTDKSRLIILLYPNCNGVNCRDNQIKAPIELLDTHYNDQLLKSAIRMSIEHDKAQLRTSLYLNTDSLERSFGIKVEPVTPAPIRKPSLRESKHFLDKDIRNIKAESVVSYYSGPSLKSPSPCPSASTANNNTIQILNHKDLLLDDLKDELLQCLIASCDKFTLSTLLKLGNLRLADNLLTRSSELDKFSSKLVFLFEDYLIVVQSVSDFLMVPLKESLLCFENGVVLIVNNTSTIWMNSPFPSIIEKWVVGLSDSTFDFPPAIITSTLDISNPAGMVSRLSDSTINIIEEVSSGSSSKQHFNCALSRSSINSFTNHEDLISDNQMIRDIMETLNVKSFLFHASDDVVSVNDSFYPEPDVDNVSSKSSCHSHTSLDDTDFASDSEYDSDQEVIQRYINKHT